MNEDKANEKKKKRDGFNTSNNGAHEAAGNDRAPAPEVGDEEYAECIYEDCAPIAPQFEDEHDISTTGAKLSAGGYASGVDTPAAEES